MDDRADFATGVRMVIAATVSAVLVAGAVIAIGQSIIERPADRALEPPELIRTAH